MKYIMNYFGGENYEYPLPDEIFKERRKRLRGLNSDLEMINDPDINHDEKVAYLKTLKEDYKDLEDTHKAIEIPLFYSQTYSKVTDFVANQLSLMAVVGVVLLAMFGSFMPLLPLILSIVAVVAYAGVLAYNMYCTYKNTQEYNKEDAALIEMKKGIELAESKLSPKDTTGPANDNAPVAESTLTTSGNNLFVKPEEDSATKGEAPKKDNDSTFNP
ncbi:MAG: hypothetical protein A3F18_06875 [Legionellales bacterium RIFCSPHIGHO2_12_FULL_37_14]|nr:MAG: hypothetical protein A3F18_06875 [Legionellales bacterium RIFCSPHIGHO2_12_FULL_37_14]